MRVRILEVHGTTHVRIACDFGELFVRSHDNRYLTPGASAGLEFDVDEVLELGRNAFVTEEETYSAENVGSSIHMRGLVDGVDDDGLIYLRLHVACLTMIEAPPGAFSPGQWIRVELQEPTVCAYLTNERTASAEARLDAFEERAGWNPDELVSLPGLGEYIAVHPCSDEVELLAKLGITGAQCIMVDCRWRILGDVHFVQVVTPECGAKREPGVYVCRERHGGWDLRFFVVLEEGPVSLALLKDALAGCLEVLRSKPDVGAKLKRVD